MKSHLFSVAIASAFSLSSTLSGQTLQLEATQAFEDLTIPFAAAAIEIDLADYFEIDGVTGQIVQIDFDQGTINIEMLDAVAPLNVANFLSYVDDGSYDNTIIHRSIAGFVIQGGSFTASLPVVPVPTRDPVVNEYALSNLRGTLSMAKLADQPDSATSGFFISVADNSEILDGQNGGFTVFARVIGTGLDVADAIAAIRTWTLNVDNSGFPFDDFPMLGDENDDVSVDFMIKLKEAKRVSMYPEVGDGSSMIAFEASSSSSGIVEVTLAGSVLTITPNGSFLGTSTISVSAVDTNGNELGGAFDVQLVSDAPGFTSRPLSRAVEIGRSATVSATVVSEGETTYQWNLDGSPIDGATEAALTFDSFTEADGGVYTLTATNASGASTSQGGELTAIAKSARLVNISTRGIAGGGDDSMIVGYYLSGGPGEKNIIIRGIGPGLEARGVAGFMTDPIMRLVPSVGDEITNDDWGTGNNIEVLNTWFARSGASSLETGSFDSVIAGSFPVSGYTAVISPKDGVSEGIVLAEVFDADEDRLNSDVRFFNISTRGKVGTGDGVLIAGFWVVGGEKANFLVRAIGPGLIESRVANVLADPQLRVVDKDNNVLATSDDWGDSLFKDSLIRETLGVNAKVPEEGSKDAATIVTLDAGAL